MKRRRKTIEKGTLLWQVVVREQQVEGKPAWVMEPASDLDEFRQIVWKDAMRSGDLLELIYVGRARKPKVKS